MKNNNLEQFIKLRRELTQERDQLSKRLAQINGALGEMAMASSSVEAEPSSSSSAGASKPAPQASASSTARSGRGRKGNGGGASLRDHVIEVLRSGPKTNREILEAVQKRGYKFSTSNPLNSLGVILYGKNPKFPRVDGKFGSPSGGGRK